MRFSRTEIPVERDDITCPQPPRKRATGLYHLRLVGGLEGFIHQVR
jgi:hypothetical protein